MTTKPKARKFRIKRPNPKQTGDAELTEETIDATETEAPEAAEKPPAEYARRPKSGRRRAKAPTADTDAPQAEVSSASEVAGENTIDAIRQEGLTGRQLRMARRVAQKHGLAPTSDFDAVRLLRDKGIDPFQRSNMLELVVPQGEEGEVPVSAETKLPQTVPVGGANLPSTEQASPMERREREISEIQRDMMRRRRKKLALLLVRLAFFVGLPTALAGYYFYAIATPMYSTKSEFLIIQNEGSGGAGPLGGLLPTQFATTSDSIAVQGYLQSKDAMLRLDGDVGFKAHFTQDSIDPIQRLEAEATNEDAYKTYKKNVKIGYDPTEGVIRMEVIAADPVVSASFSEQLISYAEQRVNALSAQKREDQMRDARQGFEEAEQKRRAAQEELVRLQLESSTLDPEAVIVALRSQITQVETQIIEKDLQLEALLDNRRPNQSRVDGVQGDINRLKEQLAKLNQRMTDANVGASSLAQLTVNVQMAQADLATRDLMLQSALQQMEQARVEASRQVRYLTVAVNPVAAQEPSYPRAFENTILAFLIFAGIYLMISLTASILREQVSS